MLIQQIIVRLLLSTIIGGLIGYERESKNRPAGIRTHILVCVGATIIALVQMEVALWSVKMSQDPLIPTGVIRSDPVRLIAQVVSGIGFLGAGTIIFDRRKITGLTTAASLWTVAALGLATGMGYYSIAILGTLLIYLVLNFVKRIIPVQMEKKIEVRYVHRTETKEFLNAYFDAKNIKVANVDFNVLFQEDMQIYTAVYTIDAPKTITYPEIIEDLSQHKNVTRIRIISV